MNLWEALFLVKDYGTNVQNMTPNEMDDIFSKNYDVSFTILTTSSLPFLTEIQIKSREGLFEYISKLEKELGYD